MPRPENMVQAQLDNLEKGRFQKGETGNPNGRPKNRVKDELRKIKNLSNKAMQKLDGLSKDEVATCEKIPMAFSVEDLKVLNNTPGLPMYLATNIREALKDYENRDARAMRRLREFQYGEAEKSIDLTTDGQALMRHPSEMTEEEILAELHQIMKSIER